MASETHAGDDHGARRRDAPFPQEHAEGREERAGQDEQQIAGDAVHADGGDRLAADHDEAGDDDERAGDALRRQPFVQNDGREHQAQQRRGRRLDDAAVAERHQQKARVADERDAKPAEERQHDAAAPADAVEVADAVTERQRQQHDAGPEAAVKGDVGGGESDVDAVPRGNESGRPEHRRAHAAGDADGDGAGWARVCSVFYLILRHGGARGSAAFAAAPLDHRDVPYACCRVRASTMAWLTHRAMGLSEVAAECLGSDQTSRE